MDVYFSKVVLDWVLPLLKSWKRLLGKNLEKTNSIISILFDRLMQEKDDKQRKGENLVDISAKKKKSRCC